LDWPMNENANAMFSRISVNGPTADSEGID
jgi:hypothetical protein